MPSDISSVSYVDYYTIKILSTTLLCFFLLFSCILQHPETPLIMTGSRPSDSVDRLLLIAVSHSHKSRQLTQCYCQGQVKQIIHCLLAALTMLSCLMFHSNVETPELHCWWGFPPPTLLHGQPHCSTYMFP